MTFNSKNTVDSKVVELTFNNQQFEANAKTSLSTLDRLKQALDFSKHSKVFDDISDGARKVNLAPLSSGIGELRSSLESLKSIVVFSWIADEAIKAKNAVEGFVKSVTVDQVAAGWQKYADKTSAVQTIMAATADQFSDTGEQMKYVNGQLEKLNWFTDETSYNFLDMVSNIGKFTSNQVELDTAVTAMEGISTWAAKSGANVTEASRAMYNLSQAISVGSVKLMDWKSIENANMATAEFKQTAIDTAESLGTLTKVSDGLWETTEGHEVSVKNFNEALKDEWFTSEVLLSTLDRYGEFTNKLHTYMEQVNDDFTTSEMLTYVDHFTESTFDWAEATKATGMSATELKAALEDLGSEEMDFGRKAFAAAQEAKTFQEAVDSVKDAVSTGWMNTFELMFGDYLEAKEFWTDLANDLYDVFASGGDARNDLIKEAFDVQSKINQSDWDRLTEAGMASPAFIKAVRASAKEHTDATATLLTNEQWVQYALEHELLTIDDIRNAYSTMFGESSSVNQGMLAKAQEAAETNEEFQRLLETLDKYSAEDIGNIIWGDHVYEEGTKDLEVTVDELLKTLGYTQDEAAEFVDVLKSMGKFGGEAANSFRDMSDEELEALGWTKEQIDHLRDATAAGRDFNEVVEELGKNHMSGKELWTDTLSQGLETLVSLFEVVKEEWANVFPPMEGSALYSIIETLHSFVENLHDTIENSETLRTVLHGVFSVFDIVLTVVKNLVGGALGLFNAVIEGLGINFGSLATSISNAVIKLHDWLTQNKVLERITSFTNRQVKKAAQQVRSWIDSFVNLPTVQKNLKNFRAGFKQAGEQLIPFAVGMKDSVSNFIGKVKEFDHIGLDNIGDVFGAFKSTVLDYLSNFPGFKKLKDAFKTLKTDIIKHLESMGVDVDGLKEKFDGFLGFIQTIPGKVMSGLGVFGEFAGSLFASFKEIPIVNKIITDIQNGFQGFTTKIGPWFSGLGDRVREFIDRVREMGGLKLDNLGDVFEDFKTNILGYFADFPGFDGIKKAFEDLKSWIKEKLKSVGIDVDEAKGKLLDFAERVEAAFANFDITNPFKSFKEAFKATDKEVDDSVEGTEENLGLLEKIFSLFSKETGDASEETKENVNGLALIFGSMGQTIKEVGGWIKDILPPIVALAGAVGIFETLKAAYNVFDIFGQTLKAQQKELKARRFLEIAASILILAGALYAISQIPAGRLWESVAVLGVLIGAMLALSIVLDKFTKGEDLLKIGLGLLAISGSIALLAASLKILETIKPENLNKVAELLVGLMLALVAMSGALKLLGGGLGSGAGILATVTSLYLLLGLFKVLDHYTLNDPVKVIGLMIACIGAIALLFATTRLAGKDANGAALAVLAASAGLILIAGAMKILETINPKKALRVIFLLAVCVAAMFALMYGSQFTGKGSTASILMLAIAIAAIAAAIVVLSIIPQERLIAATESIGIIIACLAGLSLATGIFRPATSALLSLVLVIGVIGLVLGLLSKFTDASKTAQLADGLAKVIASLALLMVALGVVGYLGPAVYSGMAALGILVAAFAVIAIIAAALDKLTNGGFGDFLHSGMEILIQLAEDIGRFFGALIGGFFDQAASYLPTIADSLCGFVEGLQPLNDVEGINFDPLLDALAAITAVSFTELITAIPNLASELVNGKSAVEQFGKDLEDLATGLKTWSDITTELGEISIPSDSLKSLQTEISNVSWTEFASSIGGLLTLGYGQFNTATGSFKNDLTNLAESLEYWSETMGQISEITVPSEEISALTTAISDVSVNSLLTTIDSVFNGVFAGGGSTLDTFKSNAKTLASTLIEWTAYMDAIGDITVPTDGIKQLSDAMKEVPESGIWDNINNFFNGSSGTIDVNNFASDLGTLGQGLTAFNESLNGNFDADKMDGANKAIQAIARISGGIMDVSYMGEDTFRVLGENFELFGEALEKLPSSLDNVTELAAASQAASEVVTTILAFKDISIDGSDITKSDLISKFSENVKTLVETINSAASVKDSGVSKLTAAVENLSSIDFSGAMDALANSGGIDESQVQQFASSGEEMGSSLASGIGSQTGAMTDAVGSLTSSAINAVTDASSDFTAKGTELVTALANGIKSSNEATSAFQSIVAAALSAIDVSGAADAGRYFAEGFANGITAYSFMPQARARAMGLLALAAAKAAINSASPSKETYKIGTWFVEGFANGISDLTPLSSKASTRMGDDALKAATIAIMSVQALMEENDTMEPVIRPVMDLSNVQNGADTIGSILGLTPSMSVLDGLGAISANTNAARNRATADDLLDVLSGIANNTNPSQGDTYIVNGVTYDDGSNITDAVRTLVRAAKVGGRA